MWEICLNVAKNWFKLQGADRQWLTQLVDYFWKLSLCEKQLSKEWFFQARNQKQENYLRRTIHIFLAKKFQIKTNIFTLTYKNEHLGIDFLKKNIDGLQDIPV